MSEEGRVVWYQPHDGKGIIQTEDGRELWFAAEDKPVHLQGGDFVGFQASRENGHRVAHDIRLVRRCIDDLTERHQALVELFDQAVMSGLRRHQ